MDAQLKAMTEYIWIYDHSSLDCDETVRFYLYKGGKEKWNERSIEMTWNKMAKKPIEKDKNRRKEEWKQLKEQKQKFKEISNNEHKL